MPENLHKSDDFRASLGIDESILDDVRSIGKILRPRVSELIEDFYNWLPALPEFQRFFADKRMLEQVKSRQIQYWSTFLRAEVNPAYVEERRRVGHTHAQIGLGLLAYLQSMQFVCDWLLRALEADKDLCKERPSAAFSIRKLIQFDAAIVVDTYAQRTMQLLDEQQERLDHVAKVMHSVSEGDLGSQLEVLGAKDQLALSVNKMVASLKGMAGHMGTIAQGDYSANFAARGQRDELGAAIQAMTSALRKTASENQQHDWMTSSLAALGKVLMGNPSVAELSDRVLACFCPLLDAQIGVLDVVEHEALHRGGTYALAVDSAVPSVLRFGEGLIGQAALEKRRILVTDIPDKSIKIRWGIAEAVPKSIVVVPLLHDDEVLGVLELGSLSNFTAAQLELLDRGSASIALALRAAEIRAEVQRLLAASQTQAEELQAQQEELRQANEELEEQAQLLEEQREVAAAQNEDLSRARQTLLEKAADLEAASTHKSDFLANMSHELRTPLNSLLILAKLLGENTEGNLSDKQVEFARTIHSAGRELLELINEILDLAKIESGKMAVECVDVAIDEIQAYLERSFRQIAVHKGLDLAITIAPACPTHLRTDVGRLQQVLKNLLSNALKFTSEGQVAVEIGPAPIGFASNKSALRLARDVVAFTVSDTGIGIPEDKRSMIFEAFRQVDAGSGRKHGGTGLGLSISREIAILLGGELRVESELGKGSSFSFFLPVEPIMAPHAAASSAPVSVAQPEARIDSVASTEESGRPELPRQVVPDDRDTIVPGDRTLLIIEDDLRFARILIDLARDRAFKAVVAEDGQSGLALARHFRPDAITLDIQLPDTSGWIVFDRLKHDPLTRHIPVHIISVDEQHIRSMAQGAVTHLQKPVDLDALTAAFEQIDGFVQRRVKRLLLVEDNEVQRSSIVELIGTGDVSTVAVGSGAEALAALGTSDFDCMVLDLGLPDMDGIELIDKIHQDPQLRKLPIIIYTGRDLTHQEELRLSSAANAIIIKDVRSPERLLAETALFLHRVEAHLPESKQELIRQVRKRDEGLQGKSVLIVDDDMRNIFALSSVLEHQGMQVSFAENGADAIALLNESGEKFSAVLMDIMMPVMDGYETMRAIRSQGSFKKLPIIAVTAKAMAGDRAQCLAAGASDYIAKPIDTDQLLSLLRVWLYESPTGSRAPTARRDE